jgi:hypothetical protein
MADDAPDMLPMASAPRDGTLIRLWLREDGSDFVGYYSDKWLGWLPRVRTADPGRHPLSRAGSRSIDGPITPLR